MASIIKQNILLRTWAWLIRLPKRYKFLIAITVLYLLWFAITTPIKNPFANDAVTLRGRFPFDQGYELMFSQRTLSSSTSHLSKILCGSFVHSNTTCDGGSTRFYPKKIDGQHYELTVYRDAYFSGLLGWVAKDRLYYRVHQNTVDGDKHRGLFYGLGSSPANEICDDIGQLVSTDKGSVSCTGQEYYKKYKALALPTSNALGKNTQEYNFWLNSELDAKMKEIKP